MQEEEVVETQNDSEELYEIAGPLKRVINYLIDYCIISFLTIGLVEILVSTNKISPPKENDIVFYYPYIIGVLFGYYLITETLFNKTIGKIFTNSLVVTDDGGKPSFFAIFLRTACRLIPLEGITFLIPNMIGLHDYLSKTRVVVKVEQ
jgi:uncharacterized RDD family membrane protein YckC